MAQLQPMYAGVSNSIVTELTAGITATATTVPVASVAATVLPDAPNIATIGTDESAETIHYTGKSGNTLTGVTRGYDGTTARAWAAQSRVARLFTNADYKALTDNVKMLYDDGKEAASLQANLSPGQNVVISDRATPVQVAVQGRTLQNPLGKLGDCESLSGYETVAGPITVSTVQFRSGNSSFRYAPVSGAASVATNIAYSLDKTKTYLVACWVYIEAFVSGASPSLSIGDNATTTYRYQFSANTSLVGQWQLVQGVIPITNTIATEGFRVRAGVPTPTDSIFYFDEIRIYELDTPIDGLTPAQIDALYPHVSGTQHTRGLALLHPGRNLVRPFTERPPVTGGSTGINVLGPYEVGLTAPAVNANAYIVCEVSPNTTYSFNSTLSPTMLQGVYTNASTPAELSGYTNTPRTFNSGANTSIRIYFRITAIGSVTVSNPMLILGTAADLPPSFVPRQDQLWTLDAKLAGGIVGLPDDQYDSRTGKLTEFWEKDFAVSGNLTVGNTLDYTGFKRITVSILPSARLGVRAIVTSHIGSPLRQRVDWDKADLFQIGNNDTFMYLSVSNEYSGWGQDYSPGTTERQALLYGWRMNNGTFGTVYNNSGTKTWIPIGDTSNTRAVTTVPTAAAPTIAEGVIDYYRLSYILAEPRVTEIGTPGISLHPGLNAVEVMSGVIWQEQVGTATTSSALYINRISLPVTLLDYKAENIMQVYKGLSKDERWVHVYDAQAYGKDRVVLINPNAEDIEADYYVTYQVLDRYAYTAIPSSVAIRYEASLGSVVGQNVEDIAKLRTHDVVQDFALDYIQGHGDNTRRDLDAHTAATDAHGATSAATASRIALRDAAGRLQVATPSAAADAATKGYVDGAIPIDHVDVWLGTTSGSGTAYTTPANAKLTAYAAGQRISFQAHVASGANPTLKPGALAALPIRKPNGNAGKLDLGGVYTVMINVGATAFILQGEGGEYGTAVAGDVRAGKTVGTESGLITGTLTERTGHVTAAGTSISGTTLRFQPPAGIFPGGSGNSVQVTDPAFLASNIRKDVPLFGLTGTLEEGARARSGTAVSVDRNDPGTSFYLKLIVTGLGFKPTSAYAWQGTNYAGLFAANVAKTEYRNTHMFYNFSAGTAYYVLSSTMGTLANQFEVTDDGFTMILIGQTNVIVGGQTYNWVAFG